MDELIGFFFTVNEDGEEWIQEAGERFCGKEYIREPIRWTKCEGVNSGFWEVEREESCRLPKGAIEKLTGKKLTWDDEPYLWRNNG